MLATTQVVVGHPRPKELEGPTGKLKGCILYMGVQSRSVIAWDVEQGIDQERPVTAARSRGHKAFVLFKALTYKVGVCLPKTGLKFRVLPSQDSVERAG